MINPLGIDDLCRSVDCLARAAEGYACFASHLVGLDDERPTVGVDRLLDKPMRTAVEAYFARRFANFDRRAAHSIWMKWYLNAFLPPVLLADLLLMRTIPVALCNSRFVIGDDARVVAVRLTCASEDSTGAAAFDRFENLIFDHFEPLIDMWSARTDVTSRVFWSNVGNTFEAMLRRVEAVSGRTERLDQAENLLCAPVWPGGRKNPLYDAVYYTAGGGTTARRRRICCLQYLLPDRRFCKACPIDEARSITSSNLVVLD